MRENLEGRTRRHRVYERTVEGFIHSKEIRKYWCVLRALSGTLTTLSPKFQNELSSRKYISELYKPKLLKGYQLSSLCSFVFERCHTFYLGYTSTMVALAFDFRLCP